MQSTKTPRRRRRTPTLPAPLMSPTPAPACLAIEDAAQSLTARARTEPLLKYARPQREQHVAAGTRARLTAAIFRIGGWALALARLGRLQLRCLLGIGCGHGFPRPLGVQGPHLLLPAQGALLPLPFPITA